MQRVSVNIEPQEPIKIREYDWIPCEELFKIWKPRQSLVGILTKKQRTPREVLTDYCDRIKWWKVDQDSRDRSRINIDLDMPLTRNENGDIVPLHETWDHCGKYGFFLVLNSLQRDYLPDLSDMLNTAITESSLSQIKAIIKHREDRIFSMGHRRVLDELRYRLGIAHGPITNVKVEWSFKV